MSTEIANTVRFDHYFSPPKPCATDENVRQSACGKEILS